MMNIESLERYLNVMLDVARDRLTVMKADNAPQGQQLYLAGYIDGLERALKDIRWEKDFMAFVRGDGN